MRYSLCVCFADKYHHNCSDSSFLMQVVDADTDTPVKANHAPEVSRGLSPCAHPLDKAGTLVQGVEHALHYEAATPICQQQV